MGTELRATAYGIKSDTQVDTFKSLIRSLDAMSTVRSEWTCLRAYQSGGFKNLLPVKDELRKRNTTGDLLARVADFTGVESVTLMVQSVLTLSHSRDLRVAFDIDVPTPGLMRPLASDRTCLFCLYFGDAGHLLQDNDDDQEEVTDEFIKLIWNACRSQQHLPSVLHVTFPNSSSDWLLNSHLSYFRNVDEYYHEIEVTLDFWQSLATARANGSLTRNEMRHELSELRTNEAQHQVAERLSALNTKDLRKMPLSKLIKEGRLDIVDQPGADDFIVLDYPYFTRNFIQDAVLNADR